ncbi:MAG: hypothetical protein N2484_05940 [Clostridia bacterium]|nr:hypothetical protein [Clostridia bacterium]
MRYNPDIHDRHSIRLKGFDYSRMRFYYITVCTKDRENFFGTVGARHWLALNEYGKVVENCITTIPIIYENVELHEFVIMPNHLHALLEIKHAIDNPGKDGRADVSPLQEHHSKLKTIGYIIGQFKSTVTKEIRGKGLQNFAWQRNYYEHIIRSQGELNQIREYILNNPINWNIDEYY